MICLRYVAGRLLPIVAYTILVLSLRLHMDLIVRFGIKVEV